MGKESKDVNTDEDESCGWGPCCRPLIFERFRDVKCLLFWLCWAYFCQGVIANGIVNSVISTLERRFDLSSTESGLISSCFDIVSTLLATPVAYIGSKGHKAKYISSGVFAISIATLAFSIPHFTTGSYEGADGGSNAVCGANDTMACDNIVSTKSLSNYKIPVINVFENPLSYFKPSYWFMQYVFYACMAVMGGGTAPLLSLGPAFLDSSVSVRQSSLYLGIYFGFAILGPSVGYILGGAILNIYVDFDTIDPTNANVPSTSSSRYVGAWWLGFLCIGSFTLFCAFILLGFPRRLPGSSNYIEERKKEIYHKEIIQNDTTGWMSLRNVLHSLKLLFKNPIYVLITLTESTESLMILGVAAFFPKIIQEQFGIPAAAASLYFGIVAVPTAAGGMALGGYLVKRLNLRVRGIIKYCLLFSIIGLLTSFAPLLSCDEVTFAGINSAYGTKSSLEFDGNLRTDTCHRDCGCDIHDVYVPVCGKDGITYFSPCFAGCSTIINGTKPVQFANCSCVGQGSSTYDAVMGICQKNCGVKFPLFMVFTAVFLLGSFMFAIPAFTITMRLYDETRRPFAVGVQWAISKTLGAIPGPILFGRLLDFSCQVWQNKCGERGSCYFYDNQKIAYYFMAALMATKFATVCLFGASLYLYKPSSDETRDTETHDNPGFAKENERI